MLAPPDTRLELLRTESRRSATLQGLLQVPGLGESWLRQRLNIARPRHALLDLLERREKSLKGLLAKCRLHEYRLADTLRGKRPDIALHALLSLQDRLGQALLGLLDIRQRRDALLGWQWQLGETRPGARARHALLELLERLGETLKGLLKRVAKRRTPRLEWLLQTLGKSLLTR